MGSKKRFRKRHLPALPIVSTNSIDQSLDVVGLDGLKRAVQLLYDVRQTQTIFSRSPEVAALEHWLLYLSMLLDVAASGFTALVLYRQSLASTFLARQAVEYVSRALYFDAHPEEALYELALSYKSGYELAIKEGRDPEIVEQWRVSLENARKACPVIDTSKRKPKTVFEMISLLADGGEGEEGFRAYRWMYKFPSQIMHGTAEGMPRVLLFDEKAGYAGNISLDPEQVTELIRSMARYVLWFVTVYDRRFARNKSRDIEKVTRRHPWLIFDGVNDEV